MDLRHLRYFLAVAQERHFGRAAQRLGISQPPLSQQIKALEDELGVLLFERTSRRVKLTEAGRLFEPEARQTVWQAERAAQTARLAHRGLIGHLRLGFTASAPFVPMIANALYQFRQTHADVDLVLRELDREEQIAEVEQGNLDIAIVRGFEPPIVPASMLTDCLLEEEMLLAMRQDHPLATGRDDPAIADLSGVPMVLYGAANGAGFNEHFIALCEEAGFQPLVAHEASSFATLLGLVAAGFGPTVLAGSLARLHVDTLIYRPFIAPVTTRLWMIHQKALSPTAAIFKATVFAENIQPL